MKRLRKIKWLSIVLMIMLFLSACGDPSIGGEQGKVGEGDPGKVSVQEEEINRNIETTVEAIATPNPSPAPTPVEEVTPVPTPEPTFTPTPEPTKAAPVMIATDKEWDFTSLKESYSKSGCDGAYSYACSDEQGTNTYYVFDFDKGKAFIFSEDGECTSFAYDYGDLIKGASFIQYGEEGRLSIKVKATNPDYLKEVDVALSDGTSIHLGKTNYEKANELLEGQEVVDRSMPTPTPTPEPTATPTPTIPPTPTPIQVSEIKLSLSNTELAVGDKVTVKAEILPKNAVDKSLAWYSDNTFVATVDQKGNVTAVGRGTVTITAVAHGTAESSIQINVEDYKNRRMRVVASQWQVNDANVGSEWVFEKKINGEYAGGEMFISAGDTLKFYCKFTENDSYPDVGTASKSYKVTKSDILNGFEVKMEVRVTEDRGKNAGKTAVFSVTFTFTLID